MLRTLFAETLPFGQLKESLGGLGRLIMPADAAYEAARQNYNRRINTYPQGIVLCDRPEAATKTIQWAQEQHALIHIRGGRHCYEGNSVGPGVVIDLSPLKRVTVDAAVRTARVQAGATVGDVHQALWPYHLTLPMGSCPSVGIAGLTLGGGHGHLSRKWGLTCDQVLGLTLAGADGQLFQVNAQKNPDLYWACRGGGGQFGVVTEFLFRLQPISRVATFSLHWPSDQIAAVIAAWQSFAPTVSDELTCHLTMEAHGGKGLTGLHCGGQITPDNEALLSEDYVNALLKPLTAIVPPKRRFIKVRDYPSAVKHFAGDAQPVFFKGKSDMAMQPLTTEGIAQLAHVLNHLPYGGLAVIFDAYGGAIREVSAEATAFAHRSTLYAVQYYAQWSYPTSTPKSLALLRQVSQAMRPFFSGYAYSNYADEDLGSWADAYYGKNRSRLQAVKKHFDPKQFFQQGSQTLPV